MLRAVAAILCMLGLSASAHAESWYRGKYGRNRVVHLSITVVGGLGYPATTWLEHRIEPEMCSWCSPPGIDRSVRDALKWNDVKSPALASDIVAYVVTPSVSLGLVAMYTPHTWGNVIDDLTPPLEAMVVTQWVARVVKLGVGRARPYAHFGMPEGSDDNLSFPSGHTSRAFSLLVGAATTARMRGYASEPYLWVSAGVLGLSTAYLRIAADRHYVTDVLAGTALGVASGLTVPWLMDREISVVPSRNGIALAGGW